MSPKSPGGAGLGQPFEDSYFWEGWRDYGQDEPRTKDVIFDPTCRPNVAKQNPKTQQHLDDLFCRLRAEIERPLVFFVKRPAFVEPPFFSKPLIKAKNAFPIAAGTTADIFDRTLEDRQRAIVVMIGLDIAPVQPYLNGQLQFWFQFGDSVSAVHLFDDQTTGYGPGGGDPIDGRTTVVPGSVENPYSLFQDGLSFGVRGPRRIRFRMENNSGVTAIVRGVFGFYQYWSAAPKGASEFGGGDLQF